MFFHGISGLVTLDLELRNQFVYWFIIVYDAVTIVNSSGKA